MIISLNINHQGNPNWRKISWKSVSDSMNPWDSICLLWEETVSSEMEKYSSEKRLKIQRQKSFSERQNSDWQVPEAQRFPDRTQIPVCAKKYLSRFSQQQQHHKPSERKEESDPNVYRNMEIPLPTSSTETENCLSRIPVPPKRTSSRIMTK